MGWWRGLVFGCFEEESEASVSLSDADKKLLDRCRRGDEAAWAELYRSHAGQVAVFVRGVLGYRHDTDDIVQKVFLEFLTSLPRFRGDASLTTWLYRIASNVVRKQIRSRWRTFRRLGALAAHSREEPATDGASDAEARDRLRLVSVALDDLNVDFRMVWVMLELQGMSISEVADALDVPQATVRTRHHRAKAKIVEAVAAHESEAARSFPQVTSSVPKRAEVMP